MKKFYIALFSVIFIITTLFVSYSFAEENSTIGQDMENMMNNVGNTVQDAGRGLVDGTKNVINNGKNMMENMTDTNQNNNNTNDNNNQASATYTDNSANNSNYTATRTATTANDSFLGMDPNVLTWLIIGIAGAAIVGLVWYYAKEHELDYNE